MMRLPSPCPWNSGTTAMSTTVKKHPPSPMMRPMPTTSPSRSRLTPYNVFGKHAAARLARFAIMPGRDAQPRR